MKSLVAFLAVISCFSPLRALEPVETDPIEIDYVLFAFNNGETNAYADMFNYALEHDREKLDTLNFRVVFFGAATDAMAKEPFNLFPDKLIHYKQLGLAEEVDRQWKREKPLSSESIAKISSLLVAKKKVWTGVSAEFFKQLLEEYRGKVACTALRDNVNADGDTDYFAQARRVQQSAEHILVPSRTAAEAIPAGVIKIVGLPSLEQWEKQAKGIDRLAAIRKLGLDPTRPIVVYTGAYGDFYAKAFQLFLDVINDPAFRRLRPQVVVVPHPHYKGAFEVEHLKGQKGDVVIAAEFMKEPHRQIKTVEALVIADLVITSDATSTVVTQACALKKKVALINPAKSPIATQLAALKVVQKIHKPSELAEVLTAVQNGHPDEGADIYTLMGIPRNSAKILWDTLTEAVPYTKTKAVVFDFGGVIAKANTAQMVEFFTNSLGIDEAELRNAMKQMHEHVSKGGAEKDFWEQFAVKRGKTLSDHWFSQFDFVVRNAITEIPETIVIVKELQRQGYQTGMLSDVTQNQANVVRKMGYYSLFHPVLLSCEIGVKKPNPEAFKILLKELQFSADSVIFIDDRIENVEAAREQGIDGIHFLDPQQLRGDLEKRGLLKINAGAEHKN